MPENYIVRFRPEQLIIDANTTFVDHYGKRRVMTQRDLDSVLSKVKVSPGRDDSRAREPFHSRVARRSVPVSRNSIRRS